MRIIIDIVESGGKMLSFVWGGIILISVIFAGFSQNFAELSQGVLDGAGDAVSLIITLAGIICLWSGIMEIGERCGFTALISKALSPVLSRLFSGISRESKAYKYISMNVSANLLGLGNAATPFGLSAMKELNTLNNNSSVASNEMVLFVVMNTASLQLVPTMIGSLRQSYGSASPFDVLPCIWVSSLCALLVGVLLACVFNGTKSRENL